MNRLEPLTPTYAIETLSVPWQKKIRLQFLYHRISMVLQNIWLESVQKLICTEVSVPHSLFEAEKQLITAFGQSKKNSAAEEADKIRIVQFSNLLIASAHQTAIENFHLHFAHVENCKEQIGQLIYLCDKDLTHTASLIDLKDMRSSLQALKITFNQEMQQLIEKIERKKELYEELQLQIPAHAYNTYRAIEIAKSLINSQGMLNTGIISSLKKHLFESQQILSHYEKELLKTLYDLKTNADFKEQIQKIMVPDDPLILSNDLIRIALNLNPNAVFFDREARIVALAALLSDIRQNPFGLCLAAGLSGLKMLELKKKMLLDFQEMISKGKLTRGGIEVKLEAPLILNIEEATLDQKILTDVSCQFSPEKVYLWKAPGFAAAGRQMDVENEVLKSSIRRNIISLYEMRKTHLSNFIEITPTLLITQIAKDTARERRLGAEELQDMLSLALIAYSAETSHCLLRQWDTCLEVIASQKSSTIIRNKILNSFTSSFSTHWPVKFFNKLNERAIKKVEALFIEKIQKALHFRYDEQIQLESQFETQGAFIPLALSKGKRVTSIKKIDSPEQLKNFVLLRLKETEVALLEARADSSSELKIQLNAIKKITLYLEQPDDDFFSFLNEVIRKYDRTNIEIKHPLRDWKNLPHLPFRDCINETNFNLFAFAGQYDGLNESATRPKSGLQLLTSFIYLSRKNARAPVLHVGCACSNFFAGADHTCHFQLTLRDPSVAAATSSIEQPVEDWVKEHVIHAGLDISHLNIWPKSKMEFIDQISQKLLPFELIKSFLDQTEKIDPKYASVHQFSQQVLTIIMELTCRSDQMSREEIACALANILLKVIPEKALNLLIKKAIKIAEVKGKRTLSLVCFFDPVSNKIQLGVIDEKERRLRLMMLNLQEWVAYMPWEIYGLRVRPLLVDHNAEIM